jgi:CheY-like chemotaxis protein
MSRQGRILVMDDDPRWRDALSDVLRRSGFHVDTAANSSQAWNLLSSGFYHLLILDIRMEDTDTTNVEGMEVLRDLGSLREVTQVIVLSAYGTKEQMRTAFRQYNVADFQSKDEFDDNAFVETVRQVFAERVRINLNLDLLWQQASGPDQVVVNLDLADGRIKRDTPTARRAAAELDDLLCRLFCDAESVLVHPFSSGGSGASVLWAQPFYTSGAGQPMIVKYGDFKRIDRETVNFEKYVQPYVGGARCTTILNQRRTPLLGAIAYSLLGAATDHLQDFGSFYKQTDMPQLKLVLDRLFLDTCGAWYANPGHLRPHNLTHDYQQLLGFTFEGVEQAVAERLKSVQGRTKLQFRSISGERMFTNPILELADQHLVRPTYVCTTHGDFNEGNILVDTDGHTWLIDFYRTGPGHILRDVAELDAAVRFQLLASEDATLEERLQMEEALLQCKRFSEVERLAGQFVTQNRALGKTFATVAHLRSLAHRLVGQNPADDISEYHIALLYYALNLLRFYWLPPLQREHALLSASLLTDRLGL